MKTTILILGLLLVFLVGCSSSSTSDSVGEESGSSLSVPDQAIEFDVVLVSQVRFDRPGFITITNEEGTLFGNSEIYLEGTYSNIGVKIADYEGQTSLAAAVVYDDGDNRFEPEEDQASGVATTFTLQ